VAGALRAGKSIFYVTPVATFRATEKGLTLVAVMPGIDVRRDVLAAAPFPIALPGDGAVPVVPRALVLGGPRG
jgi:acyl CoA:acetate/3-ketoacid CoA transferase